MKVDIIVPTASVDRWPASDSIPHTISLVSGLFELDVRVIPIESSGPGFSFSRSVNAGIRMRREGAAVVLLNDDCFMEPGWLEAMIAATRAHPTAGIFGCLLSLPDENRYQHAGGFIPITAAEVVVAAAKFSVWQGSAFWVLKQLLSGNSRFPGHHNALAAGNRVDLVTAAAMLITSECLDVIGNFDEDYPLAFEDTDFCLRAREACFDVCLVTDATGIHHQSATTGGKSFASKKALSYEVFCSKWSLSRIRAAISRPSSDRGIMHPRFCGCVGASQL